MNSSADEVEDRFYDDSWTCPFYLRYFADDSEDTRLWTCNSGCVTEPDCQTSEPHLGWLGLPRNPDGTFPPESVAKAKAEIERLRARRTGRPS